MRQILWTLIIGLFFLTACSKTSSDHTTSSNDNDDKQQEMIVDPSDDDNTERTEPEEIVEEDKEVQDSKSSTYTISGDCEFNSRKSTGTVENQEATVKKMAGSQLLIWFNENEQEKRVYVCPAVEGLVEGATVTFSGTLKEILPNERRPATPFVLTDIQ